MTGDKVEQPEDGWIVLWDAHSEDVQSCAASAHASSATEDPIPRMVAESRLREAEVKTFIVPGASLVEGDLLPGVVVAHWSLSADEADGGAAPEQMATILKRYYDPTRPKPVFIVVASTLSDEGEVQLSKVGAKVFSSLARLAGSYAEREPRDAEDAIRLMLRDLGGSNGRQPQ